MRPCLGSNIRIAGRGSSSASYRGPFSLADGSATATLRWDAANLYGFPLGPADIKATMANGVAQLEPLDLALSGGTVHLAPRVQLTSNPMVLSVPKGPLAQKIQINPAMCGSALAVRRPGAGRRDDRQGTFSIDLDDCRIPIGNMKKANMAGRFTVHSMEIGPGPDDSRVGGLHEPRDAGPTEDASRSCLSKWSNGRVHHKNLELIFPDITIRTNGWVALDKSMEITAQMPVPPKWQAGNTVLANAVREPDDHRPPARHVVQAGARSEGRGQPHRPIHAKGRRQRHRRRAEPIAHAAEVGRIGPMRLILLGTTGYHPNQRRHTPCLLLPECGVMLDAGTGVFRAAEYLATPELDIFITHTHLDHVIGLSFLFSVIDAHPLRRITLHGLPENLRAVDEHLFAPALFPVRPPFDMQPLDESFALPGGGRLTHFPLEHRGGSVGYRLDWPGRSMAYVTDTSADVERGLRGEDSRRRSVGPRVLLPRRSSRLGAEDRPQPHHAGPRSGQSRPA